MPRVAENTSQSVENPWASGAPRPLVTTSHWPLVPSTYGARRPFSVLAPVKFRPVSVTTIIIIIIIIIILFIFIIIILPLTVVSVLLLLLLKLQLLSWVCYLY